MRRTFTMILAAVAAAAMFAGLVHAVLVVAHVSEPATTTVYGLTPRRLWATTVRGMTPQRLWASAGAAVALIGAVIGGRAVARPAASIAAGSGRRGALVALVMGPIGLVSGGLILASADGGPGTGNGVVGGAAAVVLGLIGTVLGGLVLARSRRTAVRLR